MSRIGGFLSVMVVLTAFSGCAGDQASKAADASAGGGTAAIGDNDTTNVTSLVSTIVVTIEGNVSNAVNGSIPVMVGVNISFDGSGSVGDNLSYAWDFGDDTTGSNASETHAFSDAGLFNVTLMVSSGNESAESSVLLNVTSAVPAGGVVWMDTKSFTGSLPVGNPNSAFQANTDYRDHTVTILAADPNGTAVTAKRVRWTLDGSGPAAVDMTLYWRNADGNLATAATSNTADETLAYEGDMVPGDYVIRVRFNTGVNASYTVNGEIDYEAA